MHRIPALFYYPVSDRMPDVRTQMCSFLTIVYCGEIVRDRASVNLYFFPKKLCQILGK